jgi:protein TonB|tara:strand:- start:1396 stop:2271 length:876 start_codon:yes stop_codon:yes gene_type:complete
MKYYYQYCGILLLVLGLHLTVFALNFTPQEPPPEPDTSSDHLEIDLTIVDLNSNTVHPLEEPTPPKHTPTEPTEAKEPETPATTIPISERYLKEISAIKQQATSVLAKLNEKRIEVIEAQKVRKQLAQKQQRTEQLRQEQSKKLAEKKKQLAKDQAQAQNHKIELAKKKKRQEIQKQKIAQQQQQRVAAERNRKKNLAKKITKQASPIRKSMPSYPRTLRRKGIEGVVKLTLIIDPNGKVASATIRQSSGHSSFDKAAIRAAKKWRYSPAKNGLNHQVSCSKLETIIFQLN